MDIRKAMIDPAVKEMASLVGADGGTLASMAGTVLLFMGSGPKRSVNLKEDETFQENVAWIKKTIGDDVHITTDFPPIHEHLGLHIGDTKLLNDIDAAMKAGMVNALKAVKKKQAESGGLISWTDLTKIFESEGADLYRPCIEEDKTKNKYAWEDTGLFLKFDGAPSLEEIAKAEDCMKDTVQDADIWKMLEIDTELVKKVFSEEGVGVTDFWSLFAREEKRAHIAIDVGVVRFPRIDDPCFKVYRFRVIVFRSESAVLFINNKAAGIFCEFRERKYVMTKMFTEKFGPEAAEKVNAKFDEVVADFQ